MTEFVMEHPWMTFFLALSVIWGVQRIWISTAAMITKGRVTFCEGNHDEDDKTS